MDRSIIIDPIMIKISPALEALQKYNLTVNAEGDLKVAGQVVGAGEQEQIAEDMAHWSSREIVTEEVGGRERFVGSVVRIARKTAIR